MPDPMVEPMRTATALHRPSCRWSAGLAARDGEEVAIRQWYGRGVLAARGWMGLFRKRQAVDPRPAGDELSCSAVSMSAPTPHMRFLFANGLFWLSVACCLIAQVYIVQSVRGNRHVPEPTAGVPRSRDAMELVWAVLPALSLMVLLFFTWRAMQPSALGVQPPHGMVGTPP